MNWNQLEPKRRKGHCQVLENMVARDGIEPPPPAFSGLRSTISNVVIHKQFSTSLPHICYRIMSVRPLVSKSQPHTGVLQLPSQKTAPEPDPLSHLSNGRVPSILFILAQISGRLLCFLELLLFVCLAFLLAVSHWQKFRVARWKDEAIDEIQPFLV